MNWFGLIKYDLMIDRMLNSGSWRLSLICRFRLVLRADAYSWLRTVGYPHFHVIDPSGYEERSSPCTHAPTMPYKLCYPEVHRTVI